jgi:hypothetical protein
MTCIRGSCKSAGSANHPHLMIGADKEGTLYLLDRDNLGHFSCVTNQIVQTLPGALRGVWDPLPTALIY